MAGVTNLDYSFVKEYFENRSCQLLSKTYKNNHELLEILFSCGHISYMTFVNFQKCTFICQRCSGTRIYNVDEIQNFLLSCGYYLINKDEYKSSHSKVNLVDILGYKYFAHFDQVKMESKRNHKLRKFDKRNSYTVENINTWLKINNKSFDLVSRYTGATDKIIWKCRDCKKEFLKCWHHILMGIECPYCGQSKGEKRINQFLDKYYIESKPEYQFDECRKIYVLCFDFYLPNYNMVIEYQGEQHSEPVDFASRGKEWAEQEFLKNKENDEIKRVFCKKNEIKMLEISYWDFDSIEQILSKELNIGINS